jgi:hypothetical protein
MKFAEAGWEGFAVTFGNGITVQIRPSSGGLLKVETTGKRGQDYRGFITPGLLGRYFEQVSKL